MAPRGSKQQDTTAEPQQPATVTDAQAAQAARPPTQAELAIRRNSELAGTTLALVDGQDMFSQAQLASLRQLGVEHATNADLMVYFHVCQRTRLDPFARQIYLINRRDRRSATGWRQTIQTGIDGYRKIGHEAADELGDVIAMDDTTWYDASGQGYPVWLQDGNPAAARVCIRKNGQPFPGVVHWREIASLDDDSKPLQQWKTQGAHMLEKCAEAFAWRRAYPQRFQGIYTTDEMGREDDQQPPRPNRRRAEVPRVAPPRSTTGPRVAPPRSTTGDWGNWPQAMAGEAQHNTPHDPAECGACAAEARDFGEPVQGVVVEDPPGEPTAADRPKSQRKRDEDHMHALFNELGLGSKNDSADRRGVAAMLGRERTDDPPLLLAKTTELEDDALGRVIGHLEEIKLGMERSGEAPGDVTAALRRLAEEARQRQAEAESDRDA